MDPNARVMQLVLGAVDEVNAVLPVGGQLGKDPGTRLIGDGGLDSVALIQFIVAVDDAVEKQLGFSANLTDPGLMAAEKNPFATLETLVRFLVARLQEGHGARTA